MAAFKHTRVHPLCTHVYTLQGQTHRGVRPASTHTHTHTRTVVSPTLTAHLLPWACHPSSECTALGSLCPVQGWAPERVPDTTSPLCPQAEEVGTGGLRQPRADRCPPPPRTLPPGACQVARCQADSECPRHRRCCYNGCAYACLEAVPPPPGKWQLPGRCGRDPQCLPPGCSLGWASYWGSHTIYNP